jgi:Dullard-like phosphatase family protein
LKHFKKFKIFEMGVLLLFLNLLAWLGTVFCVGWLIWSSRHPPFNSDKILFQMGREIIRKKEGIAGRKKSLILDLDETLVHSTLKRPTHFDFTIRLSFDNHSFLFYVTERPHVRLFLDIIQYHYDLHIFTASVREYANPLIDYLDPKGVIFRSRWFRDSCVHYSQGQFIKNLSVCNLDLSQTVIVDNSPISFAHNRENGIPVESYVGAGSRADAGLLTLLPFLEALAHTTDVRSTLFLVSTVPLIVVTSS